jgi:hypothetical protein
MTELTKDLSLDQTLSLINSYAFDSGGNNAEELLQYWVNIYHASWIRLATIEALYLGRYKTVSIEHILSVWQRLGNPNTHFTYEFERLICRKLPKHLSDLPDLTTTVTPADSTFDSNLVESLTKSDSAEALRDEATSSLQTPCPSCLGEHSLSSCADLSHLVWGAVQQRGLVGNQHFGATAEPFRGSHRKSDETVAGVRHLRWASSPDVIPLWYISKVPKGSADIIPLWDNVPLSHRGITWCISKLSNLKGEVSPTQSKVLAAGMTGVSGQFDEVRGSPVVLQRNSCGGEALAEVRHLRRKGFPDVIPQGDIMPLWYRGITWYISKVPKGFTRHGRSVSRNAPTVELEGWGLSGPSEIKQAVAITVDLAGLESATKAQKYLPSTVTSSLNQESRMSLISGVGLSYPPNWSEFTGAKMIHQFIPIPDVSSFFNKLRAFAEEKLEEP